MKPVFWALLILSCSSQAAELGTAVMIPDRSTNVSVGADLNSYGETSVWRQHHQPILHRWPRGYSAFDEPELFKGVPSGETVQSTIRYTAVRFGLIGAGAMVNSLIRLYGGGGLVRSTAQSRVSSRSRLGRLWWVRVRVFLWTPIIHRVSIRRLGGMAGAKASSIPTSPLYGGGFTIAAGTRYYF